MKSAAALSLVLLLAGCTVWGPEGGPEGAGITAPRGVTTSTPVDATTGTDGIQRIGITTTDDLKFIPNMVRAHPGTIEFTFHNSGITPHSITLDLPEGVDKTGNLNNGQTATIRVTVTQPGQYPYPCLYHTINGMRGTLTVTQS